jgi:hypothetical protein
VVHSYADAGALGCRAARRGSGCAKNSYRRFLQCSQGVLRRVLQSADSLPPKPSRRPKLTAVYSYEWEQRKDFYKNTCGSLERHIARYKCEVTIAILLQQRSRIFSTLGLTTISGSSLIVTDTDGHPLLYFLKGTLRWLFSTDPTIQGLNALQNFVKTYLLPRPKVTDKRYKYRDQTQGYRVHYLAFWHAIGYEYNTVLAGQTTKGTVLSSEIVKVPVYKTNAVAEFFCKFIPITQAVGVLFDILDYQNYQQYSKLFYRIADNTVTSAYITSAQNHLVISDCQIFTKELKDQKDLKGLKDKEDQKDLKDWKHQEDWSLVFSLCYTAPIL